MLGQSYLADQQASKAKEIFTQLTSKEPRVASHWVGLAKAMAGCTLFTGALQELPLGVAETSIDRSGSTGQLIGQ